MQPRGREAFCLLILGVGVSSMNHYAWPCSATDIVYVMTLSAIMHRAAPYHRLLGRYFKFGRGSQPDCSAHYRQRRRDSEACLCWNLQLGRLDIISVLCDN